MASSKISGSAIKGFANASSYDAHRPSYPSETVDDLLAKLQVRGIKNACIVDLGAGTGKFSQLLAARDEHFDIMAVEPHEEMRKECAAKKLDGVKVVDDNAPKSWQPRTTWEATMKDIMWSYDDQHPRFRHEQWRQVFDRQLSSNPFTIQAADPLFSLPLGEKSVEFVYWLHPEAIWDRFRSLSQIAVLEGGELSSVKDKIFAAMNASSVEKNGNGDLPLHGRVFYAWTSAIPGAPLKNGG
ncbi:MAG: hypothetical protein LQ343_005924 [Gyalolechia ehrenbergii]|nr:MAG: hypothetical protein LQ343_005924 [Gyalolechia ehrenbergii]